MPGVGVGVGVGLVVDGVRLVDDLIDGRGRLGDLVLDLGDESWIGDFARVAVKSVDGVLFSRDDALATQYARVIICVLAAGRQIVLELRYRAGVARHQVALLGGLKVRLSLVLVLLGLLLGGLLVLFLLGLSWTEARAWAAFWPGGV